MIPELYPAPKPALRAVRREDRTVSTRKGRVNARCKERKHTLWAPSAAAASPHGIQEEAEVEVVLGFLTYREGPHYL